MDQIVVRNVGKGPLAINATWEPGVERKLISSQWKKGDQGMKRSLRVRTVKLPPAITLMPGEEATLPERAASEDQVAGLIRAGLLKVHHVVQARKPAAKAAVKAEAKPEPSKGKDEDPGEAKPRATRGSR